MGLLSLLWEWTSTSGGLMRMKCPNIWCSVRTVHSEVILATDESVAKITCEWTVLTLHQISKKHDGQWKRHTVWSCLLSCFVFNSLWPSGAIWWHRSGSTSTASYNLHRCWFLVNEILWHSLQSNCIATAHAVIKYIEFHCYTVIITVSSPRASELRDEPYNAIHWVDSLTFVCGVL